MLNRTLSPIHRMAAHPVAGSFSTMPLAERDAAVIGDAARSLQRGELVAFPTETVFGLGAYAGNPEAVNAVYALKNRPFGNPLILHVFCQREAEEFAIFDRVSCELANAFWPGPLTLVLPARTSGLAGLAPRLHRPTLAFRVPSHPTARALLSKVGFPVAAPSANRSGAITATRARHVRSEFPDAQFTVLEGIPARGLESTVIESSGGGQLRILRPGAITPEQIVRHTGLDVDSAHADVTNTRSVDAGSPGLLGTHYSPGTPLRINAGHVQPDEAAILFGSSRPSGLKNASWVKNLSVTGDLEEAAHQFFDVLHEADGIGAIAISVAPIPHSGLGVTMNERLLRASA